MRGRLKKIIISLVVIVLLAAVGVGAYIKFGKEKEKITVYLWSTSLMEEYAPYIQSKVPEADIEFIVGNNDLSFYEFLNKNGSLPDIITNRRFSVCDSKELKDDLMDLSKTEEAASYYSIYLENYRNGDGTINWLPLCGEVDGIVANKDLFKKYNIPLPTDYDSFIYACKEFEKHGIRGFVSDFAYDYTCLEILQGLSISELMSYDGKKWRDNYEDPTNGYFELDYKIWPKVFKQMDKFIKDTNIQANDVEMDYDKVQDLFRNNKVAMIRETGSVLLNEKEQGNKNEIVMLPYFGRNNQKWLLTYPAFQVSLNKKLEKNDKRKDLAMKILKVMISEEGQNYLAQKKDVISYAKDVKLELAKELDNLKPYIESNYLYVRLASEDFFSVSREVVQGMIMGKYNSKKAYDVFDEKICNRKKPKEKNIVKFSKVYDNSFKKKGGNQAASVIANSIRKRYGTDILISPSYNFTSPIFKAGYTEKMVGYMIMPNACMVYTKVMTGKDIVKLLDISINGVNLAYNSFNLSTLPIVSGASMVVIEKDNRFVIDKVLINGKQIDNNKKYKVTYLNSSFYCNELAKEIYPKQGIEAFDMREKSLRDEWIEYIKKGNILSKPTDYIFVK